MRSFVAMVFVSILMCFADSVHSQIIRVVAEKTDFSNGFPLHTGQFITAGGAIADAWTNFDTQYDVYRLYVVTNRQTDVICCATGADYDGNALTLFSSSGEFWLAPFGSRRPPRAVDLEEAENPALAFDTYLAMGYATHHLLPAPNEGIPFLWALGVPISSSNMEFCNAGWIGIPANPVTPLPGHGGYITMIGQFTVREGDAFWGTVAITGVGLPTTEYDFGTAPLDWQPLHCDLGSGGSGGQPAVHFREDTRIAGDTAGDQFGTIMAAVGDVNGDGTPDYAVGAPMADSNGPQSGSVYVFDGSTAGVIMTLTGAREGDRFGSSIAMIGDLDDDGLDDFAVGAARERNERGAVYVLSGADGSRLFRLTGDRPGDRFGFSIGGGADINDDGVHDFIVGAPLNDDAAESAGKIHVISGANGQTLRTIRGQKAKDKFGWSVAVADNLNGDAFADFFVSAPFNDETAPDAGKVYAYSGKNGKRLFVLKGEHHGHQFGFSIASNADFDLDTISDLLVGTPQYHSPTWSGWGEVSAWSGANGLMMWRSSSDWYTHKLGMSVCVVDDLNGDGFSDVVAGMPGPNDDNGDAGECRVYSGLGGFMLQRVRIASPGDALGTSVTTIGDLDGDGINDIALGAPRNDETATNAGRVHVLLSGDVNRQGADQAAGQPPTLRELLHTIASGPRSAELREQLMTVGALPDR